MNIVEILSNKEGICELCGITGDLRPYGPNGENICYDCGMNDEETTKQKFYELIGDADFIVLGELSNDTPKTTR